MRDILRALSPRRWWAITDAVIRGRLVWVNEDGTDEVEWTGRRDVWQIVRPRLPLRYYHMAKCGRCHARPVRRWSVAYFDMCCPVHMGDLWLDAGRAS